MREYHYPRAVVALFSGALWLLCGPARAAVVENLSCDLGAIRFTIPRIEATGTALSDADFRGIVDPASAATLSERLGALNAASIVAPQVILEIKAGPASNKITYRDLKLANVGGGLIDSFSVAGAGGDMKDPKGGDIKVSYGAMSAHKVNLGLMLRLFTARRADPDEPLAPVYEDFTADGFQMSSNEVDMSAGRMTGGGIRARALATPLGELFAMTQTLAAPGAKPSPQQVQQLLGVAGDMLQSLEIGRVEGLDIVVRPKREPGEVRIGRIFMGGFAKGRLGEIAYENLALTMPDGAAKLGRVGLRDLDLSRTLAAMADAARRGDPDFKNTSPRSLVPTLGQFQIAGLYLDVPDKNGAGNSADGKRIRFSLANFEVNASKPLDGVPTAITARLQNFLFPVPPNPADPRLRDIAAMGIDKFDLSHDIDIAWNEQASEIGVRDYSISLGGLGSFRLSGVIGNAPKDLFSSNLALAQAAALGAVVKSIDVTVENQGLAEKALQMQARQSGQTPQQIQQMLVAGAAMGIPAMLGNTAASKAIANALAKFAADPKRLHIVATSKEGLGAADVMSIGNPAALLDKLEITATANE